MNLKAAQKKYSCLWMMISRLKWSTQVGISFHIFPERYPRFWRFKCIAILCRYCWIVGRRTRPCRQSHSNRRRHVAEQSSWSVQLPPPVSWRHAATTWSRIKPTEKHSRTGKNTLHNYIIFQFNPLTFFLTFLIIINWSNHDNWSRHNHAFCTWHVFGEVCGSLMDGGLIK